MVIPNSHCNRSTTSKQKKNHKENFYCTQQRQPLKVKQTSQLIRHPTLSSSVQELWLQLDSETLGRSSSTHPVSYTNKKCLENKDGHTKKPSTFNHIHKMEIKIQIIKDTYTKLREYTCDAAVPARDGANPPYNLSHPSCLTTFNTNQSNSRT